MTVKRTCRGRYPLATFWWEIPHPAKLMKVTKGVTPKPGYPPALHVTLTCGCVLIGSERQTHEWLNSTESKPLRRQ